MSNDAAAQHTEEAQAGSGSMLSSLVSFFVPTAHAEEPKKVGNDEEETEDEEKEEEESPAEEEEEEEEEPEDIAPAIRQECEETQCVEPAKHFKHCSDKVEGGKGWEGEDCVEELFHLMHCVDACAAPRLFRKLA
ncbi:ubiquinol-cytochrome C reductase hinge protein-domain-containing protein [Dioszegia hungarica]|uniref:Ubiquinol-cytochrome C reductase hinge protein-domain-containing protein n=1 Tax=Dioszegia hungarica TaxID=4972 RepID=A0AA38HA51_9TREE|nr:ubiquinol-cytochrome C reductase hinge protein-domain-containing protein [Dioszegia hungarica]KAI9636678.1 ubiquinol-cytochrome C reductase hinge protein-domain-containing protein [Dioszegia hungarica]